MSFTYGGDHQLFPGSGLRAYFLNEHYRQISKAVTCEAFRAPGALGSLGVPDLLFTGGCHKAEDQSSSASHLPHHWLWKDWVCSPTSPLVFLILGSIWYLQLHLMSNVPPRATLAVTMKERQLPGYRNTIHNANNCFLYIFKNAWGFIGCCLGNIHYMIMQRKQWIFCFTESCSSWGATYSSWTSNLLDCENKATSSCL